MDDSAVLRFPKGVLVLYNENQTKSDSYYKSEETLRLTLLIAEIMMLV